MLPLLAVWLVFSSVVAFSLRNLAFQQLPVIRNLTHPFVSLDLMTQDALLDYLPPAEPPADLVFLGMREPEPDSDYQPYYERMRALAEEMPTTAFVLAAEDVPFGEVLFKQEG